MNKRIIRQTLSQVRSMGANLIKMKPLWALVGLTFVALLAIAGSAVLAQSSSINLSGGETLEVLCDGRALQISRFSRQHVKLDCRPHRGNPTATPIPDPTETPLPPTEPPPPPPPPGGEPIQPYPEAPFCEDIGVPHDPHAWHGIWDYEHGCHWRHEHKHDPNEVNHIFGPPGAWFGGNEISYPWQTTMENEEKHQAYSWIVRQDIPSNGRSTWINAFRLQVHVTSAPFVMHGGMLHGGYLARFHSYSLEAQVCNGSDQCGIVRTGGWLDFGNLEVSGHGPIPLPGEEDAVSDTGRRRIHYYYTDADRRSDSRFKTEFFWYGRHQPVEPPFNTVPLHPVVIAIASGDASVNVDPQRLHELLFFCPAYDCDKNDSTVQAHVVQFDVKASNFSGYTDRYGRLVQGCTAPGLDCIPLIIENAPTGRVQHRDDRDLGLPSAGERDFDLSPPGVWWIKHPN